jgi:hypothetical protein
MSRFDRLASELKARENSGLDAWVVFSCLFAVWVVLRFSGVI